MTGKGKGKGKGKDKIKRTEARVESKIIDLPRFAYDVIVHSALRFGVPPNCITIWAKGGENDYGKPDFISALSRSTYEKQMEHRHYWYAEFKSHYDSNSFELFQNIKCLLQRLFNDPTPHTTSLVQMKVACYLSIINEFVLFLHSVDCNLFLNELAVYWFKYLGPMKDELEKLGGLFLLYKCLHPSAEAFFDRIIPIYCIPYNGEVNLSEIYHKELDTILDVSTELQKAEIPLDVAVRSIEDSLRAGLCFEHSERDEASGIDLPGNIGVGMVLHGESLRSSASGQSAGKDGRRQPSQKGGRKGVSNRRSRVSSNSLVWDRDEASGCDILVNTGLGIPPHEEFYKDFITGRAVEVESAQNTSSASGRKAEKSLKREQRKKADQKNVSEPRSQVSSSPATSERDIPSVIYEPWSWDPEE